jgi:hypothetical protein
VYLFLGGVEEAEYARRISIGWAYPSPDNWGASRWRVTLKSLNVNSDAEPPADDGDWRFDFNTNNRDQEWTRLFSCGGCIDDQTNYPLTTRPGGPYVSTGQRGGDGTHPRKSRGLGPDPVVFPGQPILVHTSGYDDEIRGDDIGVVQKAIPQPGGEFNVASDIKDGSYLLKFAVNLVGSVGRANLTPAALALFNRYSTERGPQCSTGTALGAPECTPSELADGTPGGGSMLRLETLPGYEREGEEGLGGHGLLDISPKNLRRDFKKMQPRARRSLLKQIREALAGAPKKLRGDTNELVLTLDRALPPRLVRKAVPRYIRRSVTRLRKRRAALRRARGRVAKSSVSWRRPVHWP